MIDFTQQLTNFDGEPSTYHEKEEQAEGGASKLKETPLTLQLVAERSLLDLATPKTEKEEERLNAPGMIKKRYDLAVKIRDNIESVEMTEEDKEILSDLLPLRFDVVITGQIIDILNEV